MTRAVRSLPTRRSFFSWCAGKRFPWRLLAVGLLACAGHTARAQEPASSTYDPKSKRDPFVPCVRDGRFVPGCGVNDPTPLDALITASANPHFKLEAIVHDPSGSSLAIINDAVVTVGQRISGFEVTTIERDAVTLTRGTESLVLRITFETPESIKTPDASKEQEPPRGGEGE